MAPAQGWHAKSWSVPYFSSLIYWCQCSLLETLMAHYKVDNTCVTIYTVHSSAIIIWAAYRKFRVVHLKCFISVCYQCDRCHDSFFFFFCFFESDDKLIRIKSFSCSTHWNALCSTYRSYKEMIHLKGKWKRKNVKPVTTTYSWAVLKSHG